ncbi:MAG: hypothetical protein HQK49_11670 [Oligoflexia bacterium]|nr:hypothetical protein [Oligoflexia bacterium]
MFLNHISALTIILVLLSLSHSLFHSFFPLEIDNVSANDSRSQLKVCMILWRGETNAEKGFKEELSRLVANTRTLQFDTFNCEQKVDNLVTYIRNDLTKKISSCNYIYTYGTTVSTKIQEALKLLSGSTSGSTDKIKVKQLVIIVTDPVSAGLTKSMSDSGPNMFISSNTVPISLQIEKARQVVPFKKLAILFNSKELNSNFVKNEVDKIKAKFSFETMELRLKPEESYLKDILKNLKEGNPKADAVFIPPDSFITSKSAMIIEELNSAKIPIITAVEEMITKGALMGTVASYSLLGELLAKAVKKDLDGHTTSPNPVLKDEGASLKVNADTAKLFGIKYP